MDTAEVAAEGTAVATVVAKEVEGMVDNNKEGAMAEVVAATTGAKEEVVVVMDTREARAEAMAVSFNMELRCLCADEWFRWLSAAGERRGLRRPTATRWRRRMAIDIRSHPGSCLLRCGLMKDSATYTASSLGAQRDRIVEKRLTCFAFMLPALNWNRDVCILASAGRVHVLETFL